MIDRKHFLAAAVAAVLAVGCGSNDAGTATSASENTSAPAPTEAPVDTSAPVATDAATVPPATDGSTDLGDALAAAFLAAADGRCDDAEAIGNAFGDVSSPSEGAFFEALGQFARAFDKLSAVGPDEIRADFATMAAAFGAASDAFTAAGITDTDTWAAALSDPTKMQALSAATEGLGGADFQAASDRIEEWLNGTCPGLTTTTG